MQSLRTLVAMVIAAAGLSACDGLIVVIGTGPSSIQGAATVTVAHIDGGPLVVGHPIAGTVTTPGGGVDYRFVAPRTGTLVLGVSWDRSLGQVNVVFASNMLPPPVPGGPFTARLPVVAGETYTIQISDASTRTGAAIDLPFTVTAAVE